MLYWQIASGSLSLSSLKNMQAHAAPFFVFCKVFRHFSSFASGVALLLVLLLLLLLLLL